MDSRPDQKRRDQDHRHFTCGMCHMFCSLIATMEGETVLSIHGDKDDPIHHGFSCHRGRQGDAVRHLESRLLHSVKRVGAGHVPVRAEEGVAAVGERLAQAIARDGPGSVALYLGTYGSINIATRAMAVAFMRAIGSPMIFDTQTIDMPGKTVASALHGLWLAGAPRLESADAFLLIGSNPLVSMNGGFGPNPARALKRARAAGTKLVVIDPRLTESARFADIHLQVRPGQDATLLASIMQEMMAGGFVDRAFVAAHASGFAELQETLQPFTADLAAERCGVDAHDIRAAAEILGRARRGLVAAGTGANMAGEGTLVEYLGRVMMTLRGWWLREGDLKANPGILIEPLPAIAAALPPRPAKGFGTRLRVRGLEESVVGMPTAALADEILLAGDGQIRTLIVVGGNPMLAWPDQAKTNAALKQLDLLICIDPRLSETARLADYVLAPTLPLEVESNSATLELFAYYAPGFGFEAPYAKISPAVVSPPEGSDVRPDWWYFRQLARVMGLDLAVQPTAILDPARAQEMATPVPRDGDLTTRDIWRMVLKGSPMDYDRLAQSPAGRLIDTDAVTVAAQPTGWTDRLQLADERMMAALARIGDRLRTTSDTMLLISRRMPDIYNSNWREHAKLKRRWAYNPAFVNPADLAARGIATGDLVEISTAKGTIIAVAEAAPDIRQNCVSISHCWGRSPDLAEDPQVDGANTGRLLDVEDQYDDITGIPLMSGVPVTLRRAPIADRAAFEAPATFQA